MASRGYGWLIQSVVENCSMEVTYIRQRHTTKEFTHGNPLLLPTTQYIHPVLQEKKEWDTALLRGYYHATVLQHCCTHLYCVPGTLPLKKVGKLNLNRWHMCSEGVSCHTRACVLIRSQELSVRIHKPVRCGMCACMCTHTYIRMPPYIRAYVLPVWPSCSTNSTKAMYYKSHWKWLNLIHTLSMIRCKISSERPFCVMSSTESG